MLLLMSHGTTKANGCMLCKRRATRKRLQEFQSLCRMIKGICRMGSIASFSLFNYVDVLLTHRRKQVSAELIRILNYLYWPSSSSKPLTLSMTLCSLDWGGVATGTTDTSLYSLMCLICVVS